MDETERKLRGETFRDLHVGPEILVLPNPWDRGTARLFENMGFKALAATSAGLAFSLGRRDGDGTFKMANGDTYTSLYGPAVESGAPLTMEGFRRGLSGLGDWGHLIVVICVLLFAISTAISWSYYGDRCANYLFCAGAVLPYKMVFVAMHFVGAVLPLAVVWNFGDIFLAIVIVPNLIALIMLTPKVAEETKSYFERKPWLSRVSGGDNA